MQLKKCFLTMLTVIGSVALGSLSVAQEKKDEKPAAPKPPSTILPAAQPAAVAERTLTSLTKILSLTDDQRDKIKPFVEQEATDMKALREDKNLSREARMNKWKEIRESTRVKVKPLLNDEQAKKWEQMRNPRQVAPTPPPVPAPPAAANPADAPKPAAK